MVKSLMFRDSASRIQAARRSVFFPRILPIAVHLTASTQALTRYAGRDATEVFYSLHRHEVLDKYAAKLQVGVMEDDESEAV